uniref:Uncharacterized protein n=1 Tax=Romanomermis culicivorax TaxID=13658 RepID=A0A915II43_ROMCU
MDYYQDPPYSRFKRTIVDALKAKNFHMEDKYDWELEFAARTIATMIGPAKRAVEENVSVGDEGDSSQEKVTT